MPPQLVIAQYIISIHAPRAGSDNSNHQKNQDLQHFNPRSPCGERPLLCHNGSSPLTISIHAPRAGSDACFLLFRLLLLLFQSTLPVRGATFGCSPASCW